MVRSYWYYRYIYYTPIFELKNRYRAATNCKLQPITFLMKRSIVAVAPDVATSTAVTSVTTAATVTEVVDTAEPVDVALVWKYITAAATTTTTSRRNCILHEPHIYVSLQPITDVSSSTSITAPSIDPNIIPTSLKVPATDTNQCSSDCIPVDTGNCENDIQTNHKNDVDVIPESVLIYERQIRKAQHAKKSSQPLTDSDLNVIYVDEYMVVINKPAGVLTVPGLNNNPSILDLVYKQYGINSVTDPVHMIVHRLDMDTSGIVVFARTLSIAKQLHTIFRDRVHITKQYECLVMGHLRIPPKKEKTMNANDGCNENEFTPSATTEYKIVIDLPIQRDHVHPPFMRISTPRSEKAAMECVDQLQLHGWKKIIRKAAKPSQSMIVQILEYGTYKNDDNIAHCSDETDEQQQASLPYTRLRLEPITGRTHQLRVHCAAIGYPIVGDPTYSLYGEAALFGGVDDLHAYLTEDEIATKKDVATSKTESNNTTTRPTGNMARCSINVMKAWTMVYPPNVKPMCLHAVYLKLRHPVTGETCEWDTPATF